MNNPLYENRYKFKSQRNIESSLSFEIPLLKISSSRENRKNFNSQFHFIVGALSSGDSKMNKSMLFSVLCSNISFESLDLLRNARVISVHDGLSGRN